MNVHQIQLEAGNAFGDSSHRQGTHRVIVNHLGDILTTQPCARAVPGTAHTAISIHSPGPRASNGWGQPGFGPGPQEPKPPLAATERVCEAELMQPGPAWGIGHGTPVCEPRGCRTCPDTTPQWALASSGHSRPLAAWPVKPVGAAALTSRHHLPAWGSSLPPTG